MANLENSPKQNKTAFLKGMHALHMCDMHLYDDNMEVMQAHMINYNARFLPKEEINGSDYWTLTEPEEQFFDVVNSEIYNDPQRFYALCEEYMDMSGCGTVRQRVSAELDGVSFANPFQPLPEVRLPNPEHSDMFNMLAGVVSKHNEIFYGIENKSA